MLFILWLLVAAKRLTRRHTSVQVDSETRKQPLGSRTFAVNAEGSIAAANTHVSAVAVEQLAASRGRVEPSTTPVPPAQPAAAAPVTPAQVPQTPPAQVTPAPPQTTQAADQSGVPLTSAPLAQAAQANQTGVPPTPPPATEETVSRWKYFVGSGVGALVLYLFVWFVFLPAEMRPSSLDDGFARWVETQCGEGPPNCVLAEVHNIQEEGSTVSATLEFSGGKVVMFQDKAATLGLARLPDGIAPTSCTIKIVLQKGETTLATERVELGDTPDSWQVQMISSEKFHVKTKYMTVNQAAWAAAGVDLSAAVSRLKMPEKPFSFAARALGLVLGVLYLLEGLPVTGQFLNFSCIVISVHSISSGLTYLNMTVSFWCKQLGHPLPWYLSMFSSNNILTSCIAAISIAFSGFFFILFRPLCDEHVMTSLHGASLLVATLFGVAKWRGEAAWFSFSRT